MHENIENSAKPEWQKNKKLHELRKWAQGAVLGTLLGMSLAYSYTKLSENIKIYKTEQHLLHEEERFEKTKILNNLVTKDGNISTQKFEKIAKETFPKNWVKTVKSIYTTDEKATSQEQYGMDGRKWETLAQCIYNRDGSLIVFRPPIYDESLYYTIQHTFGHELAHSYKFFLSRSERGNLDKKLQSRVRSPTRYKSSYVESISSESEKITEYWAEISAQYFEDASKLNIADFELVNDQIAKSDPDFNWASSSSKRNSILASTTLQTNTNVSMSNHQ